jgi:hypothetical protein
VREEKSKVERGDETTEMDIISTAYCLRKETPYPELVDTKDFLCFHIALSRGRIKDKTTVDSVKTFTEWFFAGLGYRNGYQRGLQRHSLRSKIPWFICWTALTILLFV